MVTLFFLYHFFPACSWIIIFRNTVYVIGTIMRISDPLWLGWKLVCHVGFMFAKTKVRNFSLISTHSIRQKKCFFTSVWMNRKFDKIHDRNFGKQKNCWFIFFLFLFFWRAGKMFVIVGLLLYKCCTQWRTLYASFENRQNGREIFNHSFKLYFCCSGNTEYVHSTPILFQPFDIIEVGKFNRIIWFMIQTIRG